MYSSCAHCTLLCILCVVHLSPNHIPNACICHTMKNHKEHWHHHTSHESHESLESAKEYTKLSASRQRERANDNRWKSICKFIRCIKNVTSQIKCRRKTKLRRRNTTNKTNESNRSFRCEKKRTRMNKPHFNDMLSTSTIHPSMLYVRTYFYVVKLWMCCSENLDAKSWLKLESKQTSVTFILLIHDVR